MRWDQRSFGEKLAVLGLIAAILAAVGALWVVLQMPHFDIGAQRALSSMPQEADDALNQRIAELRQNNKVDVSNNYQIVAVQKGQANQLMDLETDSLSAIDELWCVFTTSIDWGSGKPEQHWYVYKIGITWTASPQIVGVDETYGFRSNGCSIG